MSYSYLLLAPTPRSQTLFGNDIVSATLCLFAAKQSFEEQGRSQTEFGNEESEFATEEGAVAVSCDYFFAWRGSSAGFT